MRVVLTFLIVFGTMHLACSQQYVDTHDPQGEEIKSLLSKESELNAFGALDLKFTELMDERAMLLGAYGGLVINRRFLFGLAGYGLATEVSYKGMIPNQPQEKKLNLHGGYGGLVLGATIAPRELVHISIPIIIGAGSLEVVDKDFFVNNLSDSEFTIEDTAFFVIEPGLQMEFNITRSFRIGAGATYRHISGSQLNEVSDDSLSGLSAVLSLRLGRF